MIKVLIADDEKNICMLIKKLVNWESYGMEIIDIVHNGVDAVRVIEKQKPELVITDIRMPGYSGLDIVRKTREMGMDTDFVIISGYKQFEYAHTAINLGVDNYLLKPIDKKELEASLQKISKKFQVNVKQTFMQDSLKQQAIDNKKHMRQHFLNSIIDNDRMRSLHDGVDKGSIYGFEKNCFRGVFSKIDAASKDIDITDMLVNVESMIDRSMESFDHEYINTRTKSGIVTVVNYSESERDLIIAQIERTFAMVQREMDKFSDLHLTLGVGGEKKDISDVSFSIKEAVDAVKCRSRAGLDKIIWYEKLHYVYVDSSDFVERHRIEFRNMVTSLDGNALAERFSQETSIISGTAFCSPVSMYDYIDKILDLVKNELISNKVSEQIVDEFYNKAMQDIDYYINVEELSHRIIEDIRECFGKVMDDRQDRSLRPIRMAKQFIESNYQKQISQEEVADAIGISPSYLSTMFKKELGINFTEYLCSCRMEAAKNLLKNTDDSVAVIAEKVGFTDHRYFSKVFHKTVGLKPSIYRKMYR